jgi:hypothetical protein
VFNPQTGNLIIDIFPPYPDQFTAILSLRHPNVPGSEHSITFQALAIASPATTATATAAAAASPQLSSQPVTSNALLMDPVLNPLVNPSVTMLVQFPGMTAAGYGGAARAEADFKAILAQAAGLEGVEWVTATVTNSTPLVLNATVRSELGLVHVMLVETKEF